MEEVGRKINACTRVGIWALYHRMKWNTTVLILESR